MMKTLDKNVANVPKEAKREVYLAMKRYTEKKDSGTYAAVQQACAKACPSLDDKATGRIAENITKDWTMRVYFTNLKGEVFKAVAQSIGIIAIAAGFQIASIRNHEPMSPDIVLWALTSIVVPLNVFRHYTEFKVAREELGKLLEELAGKEISAKKSAD